MIMKKFQRGATMIEAMVALFVLAIGLMGMFSLQVKAVKGSQVADEYSRASYLANELMEMILVSREPSFFETTSKNGVPGFDGATIAECFGPAKKCNLQEASEFQFNRWATKMLTELPTADIAIETESANISGISLEKVSLTLSFTADVTSKDSLNAESDKSVSDHQQVETIVLESFL